MDVGPPNPNPNNTSKDPNRTVVCGKGANYSNQPPNHAVPALFREIEKNRQEIQKLEMLFFFDFFFAVFFPIGFLSRPCISQLLSLIHRQWRRKAALGPRFFTSCVACGLFRIKPNASPTLVWRKITRYHMLGEILQRSIRCIRMFVTS